MNTLLVKNPSNRYGLMAVLLNIFLIGILFGRTMTPQNEQSIWYYGLGAVLILYVVYALILLLQQFSKPKEVHLEPTALRIGNHLLETDDIDEIRVGGRFATVIAIKPKGKKVVPLRYCFSFANNEDEGIVSLGTWAEAHQIAMINRQFMRWI
ncbi:hypothetical protein [Paenibacillus sp. WLX2291]|uniref:hypothetical protein n=1 Tax=Paenibacillus sp. WLX2291 TaxID=3296934 RepID=UPI00398416CC